MIKEIKTSEINNILSLYNDDYKAKEYYLNKGLHKIYYEVSGNPKGIPVVFVHGGPGSPMGDLAKRFFNKDKYYIVVIDQRGSGKSLPFGEIKENNTMLLIEDMEDIRKKLNIDKWIVFGGSWGSTLSLIYAINHADRVIKLVLRGIFLVEKDDISWLYQEGASHFYPKEFEEYVKLLSKEERKDIVNSYYKYLKGDIKIAKKYAKSWSDWENTCVRLIRKDNSIDISNNDITKAIMECHYFVNDSFIEKDYILKNTDKIKDLDIEIVHGRYDIDCRISKAYKLYKKLNNAKLYVIQDAGHSSLEPGITHLLMKIMEEYSENK